MARYLVVGGASWDTLLRLDRLPEPRPQTIFAKGSREALGSTGAGKALNLRALGHRVVLHAMLGDDEPGRRVRARLEAAGVELLHDLDPAGTERHVNLMDEAGGRISIYASSGTFEPQVDLARLERLLPAQDAVLLNILNYCRRLIPALRASGKPIWCDLHDWDGQSGYHRDFAEAADHLFLSDDALPGWRPFLEEQIARGKRVAVCTHGRHGATALTAEGRWIEVPAAAGFARVDVNGAGDAFCAGTLHGRSQGRSWEESLRLGAVVAGMCVASEELVHPDLTAARAEAALAAFAPLR